MHIISICFFQGSYGGNMEQDAKEVMKTVPKQVDRVTLEMDMVMNYHLHLVMNHQVIDMVHYEVGYGSYGVGDGDGSYVGGYAGYEGCGSYGGYGSDSYGGY